MPDPVYQRLFGCAELSTRTASTFARAERQVRREVEREARVAARPRAEPPPVQEHGRVPVHAVELDAHPLLLPGRGSVERPAIPADARREVAAAVPGRVLRVGRSLDAPVVRKAHAAPRRIVERRRLGAGRIALDEPPVEVRREDLPRGRLRLRSCGERHQGDREQARETPERPHVTSYCFVAMNVPSTPATAIVPFRPPSSPSVPVKTR